jgi:nitroreductase/NAD-dependent dihydropyrimidine dehydrogenase PreA subunit
MVPFMKPVVPATQCEEKAMPWEDVKQVFRPQTVQMGVMTVDVEKCTRPRGSKCQLCLENCPFKAWEIPGDNQVPLVKEEYECFSCYNCMAACPRDAVSIVESYHVQEGPFATDPHPLPAKLPIPPQDAEGNPDEWNPIEEAVFHRRSVRNYKDKSVPEPIIRRVLEAGRFAPSAGNCQPWKFIVVTDRAFIREMDEAICGAMNMTFKAYTDDELVKNLAAGYEARPNPGSYDPRVIQGGIGAIARRYMPTFLGAPAVILIAGDERAIGGAAINVGICGQNMNLVANSLGIKACWVGFSGVVNMLPAFREKLGLRPPWTIVSSLVLGYPRFKQEGVVPREFRPIAWLREGREGPEIEE